MPDGGRTSPISHRPDVSAPAREVEREEEPGPVVPSLRGGPGRVLRISPGEGVEVRKGSKVTLFVF